MGSQNFGYKPGDPVKVGDLNNLLSFQNNISTDNGVIGRDGAYLPTPPTNEQSMADLSERDFSMEQYPVRSHSVIYATKNGDTTIWSHKRKRGVQSQAYYTLGNVSIEATGTQKLDRWGTPVLDENGQPVIGEFGNKYMVAVQAMVPGMKYVLRCDPYRINNTDSLKNGDLCYWGGWDGLRLLDSDGLPDFSVVRYEYNRAPLSPQDTFDPLLDLRTRELFWRGEIFVSTESITPSSNTNIEETYYIPLNSVNGLVFVQTDLNTGGNDIDLNAVLNEYQYLDATNFEISPALAYMGEAVSGNTNTVFYKGQEYYLVPYMYSMGDCWQSDDGFVYSSLTGKVHPGYVPRLPNYRVADTINDLGAYQDDFENTLQTYWSVPKWDLPGENSTHNAFIPTEYANPIDTGYAECIYHPAEDTTEEKVVTNVARVILPISKMLRSDIKPRPNVFPRIANKITEDEDNKRDTFFGKGIPASFYSTKAMGLIEPTNSNPIPQRAYHYVNRKVNMEKFKELLDGLDTTLGEWTEENQDDKRNELAESISGLITQFADVIGDKIGDVSNIAQDATKEQFQQIIDIIKAALATYECIPGFTEVPFCEYAVFSVNKQEYNTDKKLCIGKILGGKFKDYGFPVGFLAKNNFDFLFPRFDIQEFGEENGEGSSGGEDNVTRAAIVNGVYLSMDDIPIPIQYKMGYESSYLYMQKVEIDTVSSNGTNFKAPLYKKYTDFNIDEVDKRNQSTAGWTAYRYLSDNPDITDDINEETFTFTIGSFTQDLKLQKPEVEENNGETGDTDNGENNNGGVNGEDTGTNTKVTYKRGNKEYQVDLYRFLPLAYFSHSGGDMEQSTGSTDESGTSGGINSSGKSTDYEEIYGKFTIKKVDYQTVGTEVLCTVTVSFKPAKPKGGKKLYNDLFSLPFLPHDNLVRNDVVENNIPLCAPRHPMAVTTKEYKAQRSDWIPAICTKLDQNEVLIPGMLVNYVKGTSTLKRCDGDDMITLGEFVYAEIQTPPESYSAVTEGTPNYEINKITYKIPKLSEANRGGIADDDVYVTNIEVVDEIPAFNITGNEYYIGVKLDTDGYPDIREPFGGFRDCDNLGNMTVFFRTTPFNISFTCTGRLDFIPFGYAVPSRTPSCYYKTSGDDCAVNFVNTRYIMKRINDNGIENQLFLSGACYVPCSSLTSLGSND